MFRVTYSEEELATGRSQPRISSSQEVIMEKVKIIITTRRFHNGSQILRYLVVNRDGQAKAKEAILPLNRSISHIKSDLRYLYEGAQVIMLNWRD